MRGGADTSGRGRPSGPAEDDLRALPRVEIAVRDPGRCPVLAPGGRMIYAHPEILGVDGGRICAQALSAATPVAREAARAAAQGRRMEPLEIECPAEGCGALLVIQALPFGADGPLRAADPQAAAPPATGFGEPGRAAPPRRDAGSSRSASLQTQVGRLAPVTGPGPFLSRLESDLIKEIVELSEVAHYGEPTVIIREGQEGEALYIVAEGEIEVLRRTDDGQEIRLALVGKGECLGEMSLLTGQPASATVRTRGDDAVVLVLRKATLEALLTRRPTLHREFSRIIAQRLYSTNVRLEAGSSRGISGSLSMIGVVDLVQTLHASRRTGTLTLTDDRGTVARVGLEKGAVSSAVVGGVPGAEGFFGLLRWSGGTFAFEGGEAAPGPESAAAIRGDTMALLMEGLRRLDEGGRR